MSEPLMRFEPAIVSSARDTGRLEDALTGESRPGAVQVSPGIELGPLRESLEAIGPGSTDTDLDRKMVKPLYETLRLSRREAARPGVWQWLTVVAFPEITWRRWMGTDFPPNSGALAAILGGDEKPTGLPARYLGRATVGSLARNSFARLWWTAETLGGDMELTDTALGNSDLFVGVFERRLGLNPAIARACVKALGNETGDVVKSTLKGLQQRARTTRLEVLDEDQLEELVSGLAR
jgi:hypothetical protein